ncbi:MAG: EF-P lysine aminoacylase GenX [Candidatus Latescibacteria bacterium]|nr:EF-P lysine aminoacylase GenX [Candidatus Latescibacterota bacterium]
MHRALELRAQVLAAIRGYFGQAGFLEVETPSLVPAPGQEAHLQLFETTFHGREPLSCFLVSSPEHHMKRLLGAGCERIFQVGRAFRNGERTASHNPEFCMLEWYRAYASYEEIMVDVEELVAAAGRAVCGSAAITYQGRGLDLSPPWPRMSVREAFGAYAGFELDFGASREHFQAQAGRVCASVDTTDTWEEIFFKMLLEKVEPGMTATGRPVLLKDYPASMAALAKIHPSGVAERVEAYAGGLELANGFTELNDPVEQGRRFDAERAKRAALGYPVYPLDVDFLAMLALGMPPAGGMALGVDRLVMLLADAAHIDEVIAFPFALAEGLE